MGEAPAYAPQQRPRRVGLAVAAMVCGIAGVFFFWVFAILPLLATVFGFVSASSVKKSNGTRSGLGMARAGWVLGVLGIVAFGVFAWAAITDRLGVEDDTVAVDQLELGDCVKSLPAGGTVFEMTLVDCALPHAGEVYAAGDLNPGRDRSFPGDSVVSGEVEAACLAAFEPFVGMEYNVSVLEVQYLQSNEIGWKISRGSYTCFVFEPGKRLGGTLRNADR